MKNALIKTLASLAVAFAVVSITKADPVSGGIDFGNFGQPGATVVDNGNGTSTLAFDHEQISGVSGAGTTFANVVIGSNPTIDFANILLSGSAPAFSSAALDPANDNGGNLWSFSQGINNYSFAATTFSVTADLQNPGAWVISGNGVFSATGYDNNTGAYHLEFSTDGQVQGFALTTSATVPDSGTTALLLGLGLLAVGAYGIKRKLVA